MNYAISLKGWVLAASSLMLMTLLLLAPIQSQAQEQYECGTSFPAGRSLQSLTPYGSPDVLSGFLSTATRHINIAIHVVRYSNGTGGIGQNEINTATQQLAAAYVQANISFLVISTDYINSNTYANLNLNENYQQIFQENRVGGALNVYFVPNITDNSGNSYNGVAEDIPGRACAILNSAATNGTTLAHEVGHDFWLFHTHETGNGVEHITRTDVPGCEANCESTGDLLCDTPADPNVFARTGANCQYQPGPFPPFDPCLNLNYAPDMANLMSYAGHCRNSFTEGQIGRMHYALTTLMSDLIQVSVSVSNKVNGAIHSGSTLTINGQVITSPANIPLLDGDAYPGKTNHERLSGDNKHKDWNAVASEYTLSKDFTVDRSTENGMKRDANFTGLSPVTVTTQLIEGGTGGTLQFNDPWYLNSDGTQGNNFGPQINVPLNQNNGMTGAYNQTTGGVFLNQDYNIPGNPYYSVGAVSPQTLGGITSYFKYWTASGATFQDANAAQTGVVFNNGSATATAVYKAHFGSSSSNATAPNNQRKLVKWGGYHHLVYPSGGQVWYTYSADNGENWSVEEVLPAVAGYPNINLSLDVDGLGNVYVVYETQLDGSHRALFLQKKTLAGWNDLLGIPMTFLASAELKPVIAVSKDTYLPKVIAVVQANGYTSSDPGLFYVHVGYPIGKVSETSASSLNPTFAYFNLAYQENNAIYHKRVDFGQNPVTFSSRTLVSTSYFNGRPLSNISNPNIAVREGVSYDYSIRPVIAWQATDLVFSTYRPIFVRHPVSGGGTPVFVLTVFNWATSNAHGKTPSVNVYQTPPQGGYQNPDVSVVWQDDPNDANGTYPNVVAANKISGYWNVQSTIATSSASSSVAQGDVSQTSSGGALIVRTGSSGPPYALTASERTNYGQIEEGPMAKVNSTSMDYARSVNIDLAGMGINGLSGVLSLYIRNQPRFGLRHLPELLSVEDDFLRLEA